MVLSSRLRISILLHLLLCCGAARKLNDGDRPDELELVHRPEGTCPGPDNLIFVSQIITGGVVSFDVLTGERKDVVPAQSDGRQAWGLWYYKDAIFVAGGGAVFGGGRSEIYVYSASTGDELVTCIPISNNTEFGLQFMNDVTVLESNGMAYVTDSFHNMLAVMDADAALAGNCDMSEYPLPIPAFTPATNESWSCNGVAGYSDGLVVAHETDGAVYYLNLEDGSETQIVENGGAAGADGLAVYGDAFLYVTQNSEDQIGVFSLDGAAAMLQYNLTSDKLMTPATSSIKQGYIYATNARFYQVDPIEEENTDDIDDNVIGLDCSPDCGVADTKAPSATPAPTPTPTVSGAATVSASVMVALMVAVAVASIFL